MIVGEVVNSSTVNSPHRTIFLEMQVNTTALGWLNSGATLPAPPVGKWGRRYMEMQYFHISNMFFIVKHCPWGLSLLQGKYFKPSYYTSQPQASKDDFNFKIAVAQIPFIVVLIDNVTTTSKCGMVVKCNVLGFMLLDLKLTPWKLFKCNSV